jgi:hypothetical protein
MTQAEKLIKFLNEGNTITSRQAESRFKIRNLRALIHELRSRGYSIYATRDRTTGTNTYRIGRPSRKMVALAYQIQGSELFTNR